jgi:hypothetical protein
VRRGRPVHVGSVWAALRDLREKDLPRFSGENPLQRCFAGQTAGPASSET